MKPKPPLPLVVISSAYLLYLAWMTATQFSPVVAGRLAISAILIFLVLRGSRAAGNILAVLCAISGVVLVIAAVATISSNPTAAVIFVVMAAFTFAFASYLYFSTAVRAFQTKPTPLPAP